MSVAEPSASPPSPPVAEARPHSVRFHGEALADPYAWLRNREDPAVRAYLEAENAYAQQVLADTAALQQRLYDEMLGRIKQTDLSVPFRKGAWLYYSRTEEGKQYPVFCRKRSAEAPEQVLLDQNLLAEGKSFMAVAVFEVSDDGMLLAYSTDDTGYRDYRLSVKDLATGELLPIEVDKVGSAAWAADSRTLFYAVEDDAKRPYRLLRRALEGEAALLYEEPDEAFRVDIDRTRSGTWLLLGVTSHTTSETRVLKAATPMGEWRLIAPRRQDIEYDVDHYGDRFYIRVNDTGRTFRLVEAPVDTPEPASWHEAIPSRDEVMLEEVDCFAAHVVLSERVAGLPRLRVLHPASGRIGEVPFPDPICEAYLGPNEIYESATLRYHYQSLTVPTSVLDYEMDRGDTTLLKQTEVLGGYEPSRYRTERLTTTAPDGTAIPVSVVYREGRPRDTGAPLLLEGYGAYGIPYAIAFSSNRVSLLDRGVAVAIAHIRGGGELGKPWHDQGRMREKMNTFTDFIAAADHLVAEGWTSRDRLAIEGGSAGGLLMGAVVNLRPDLCAAVLSHVPFVDVLNTMSDTTLPLTVGEFEEWGNPADREQFGWIRAYDPYSNLRPGSYPAMLVRTAFNDSQVMFWEPAKYVARLRTLKRDSTPLLLVTNMGAGHGGASGRYDRLREVALDYAFILRRLGLEHGPAHGPQPRSPADQ